MSVTAVTPTYVPDISNVPISADALDATSIVSYCASRLNSLDDLIKQRFDDQQTRNQAMKDASTLIDTMNHFPSGVSEGASYEDASGKTVDASADHRNMGVDLATEYANTRDPQIQGKILETFKIVTGRDMELGPDGKPTPAMLDRNGDPHAYIDASQIHALDSNAWQAKIGDIKSLQDGFTKDNEIGMISLQSIVSQRQLGVQMTTQMLSTMNDTSKQILNNFK